MRYLVYFIMRSFRTVVSLILLPLALALSGCATDGPLLRNPFSNDQVERQLEKMTAPELYKSAQARLNSGDYVGAIKLYERIQATYPFSRYATQTQMESIYAHYRNFNNEVALAEAARFMKQHPRNKNVDYVYYLRGVIYQTEIQSDFFSDILGVNKNSRSPEAARSAFDAFALLIQRYPNSHYASDARQRMVFLKNRLARHELIVAEYYLRRRAYVAASRRCQSMLAQYQGTDSIPRALQIMQISYSKLGLKDLAANAQRILSYNYPDYHGPKPEDSWWPFGDDDQGADTHNPTAVPPPTA